MLTLAIETSCDDTSAAVLRRDQILSNIVSSQVDGLRFGGIVPELASRAHMVNLFPVIDSALGEAGVNKQDLELIAVTRGPGLIGSLLVGVNAAKAMAYGLSIPFIGVHHIEAHMIASFLDSPAPTFPFIALIVSGGHTQLALAESLGKYKILGQTMDDAVGECYDKVARILKVLPETGSGMAGPALDARAQNGNPEYFKFPRPMLRTKDYHFSFSGLKTSVLNFVEKEGRDFSDQETNDICASFQEAAADVLSEKTIRACVDFGIGQIVVCGGVAANSRLRSQLREKCEVKKIGLFIPRPKFCTDNAAMIGITGYLKYQAGERSDIHLSPKAGISIESLSN